MMEIKHLFGHITASISGFLSPSLCLVCSDLIDSPNHKLTCICEKCFNQIPLNPNSNELITRLIGKVHQDDLAIDKAVGLINLKDDHRYMNLIHNLKYYNYRNVGYELGRELAKYADICGMKDFDYVIPIPIHSAKRRERGYNQSDLIAKAIADYSNSTFSNAIAKRRVYTSTQTKLGVDSRSKNVSGVFQVIADRATIAGKTILITDDVFTTGSTINSLALELLENGVRSVYAATLAVA